jgi:hypothetical protein
MDEPHFLAAARYVPMNPARVGLTANAADWPWSSVHAHLPGRDDGVVRVAPILERVGDFAAFLDEDADQAADRLVAPGEVHGLAGGNGRVGRAAGGGHAPDPRAGETGTKTDGAADR